MANHEIKKYTEDPLCAECEARGIMRHVKGWGKAKCDNCGRTICRHHRDYAPYFECKKCRDAKQNFINSIPSNVPATASNNILKLMKTADILSDENNPEADEIIKSLQRKIWE